MIEEVGIVVELHGGRALVRTERSSACAGCGSAAFCHLSEAGDACTVEAENPVGAAVGQRVQVAVSASAFLQGAFLLYLFPLVGLFTGMAAGYALAPPGGLHLDRYAGLGGIFGLVLFFLLQRVVNRRVRRQTRFRPAIVRIL